jgi:hypothetical protein
MTDPGTCEMGAFQVWSWFNLSYYTGNSLEERRKNSISSDVEPISMPIFKIDDKLSVYCFGFRIETLNHHSLKLFFHIRPSHSK